MKFKIKFFVDDLVIHDAVISAYDLNHGLQKIN